MAKSNEAPAQANNPPSMEEILKSIRGVISGDPKKENDVLELTEMVDSPADFQINDNSAVEKPTSVLDEIDAALTIELPDINADSITAEQELAQEVINAEKIAISEDDISASDVPIQSDDDELLQAGDSKDEEGEYCTIGGDEVLDNKNIKPGRLLNENIAKQTSIPLQTLVRGIGEKHIDSPCTRGGTTLEDLVVEAMKPFLAEWLNKNLPTIVKKIVEKEVRHLIPKEEDDE